MGDVVRRHAGEARFHGQVEQDRQVRADALRRRFVERAERFEGHPRAEALVGECRVGVAAAHDDRFVIEGRPDHLSDEVSPGRFEQEGIGQRVGRFHTAVAREQDFAQLLAETRTARLAGDDDWSAGCPQALRQPLHLVVLPDPSGPSIVMNRPRLPVTCPSVAAANDPSAGALRMPTRRPDRLDGVQRMEVNGIRMDIRRLGATAGLLGAAALVAALGAGPLLVTGADHLDAPGVKADKRTDITDVYAFASQGGTTVALNINPLTSPADTAGARLSDTALYQFLIDTNADAKADIAYRLRFSKPWQASNGSMV